METRAAGERARARALAAGLKAAGVRVRVRFETWRDGCYIDLPTGHCVSTDVGTSKWEWELRSDLDRTVRTGRTLRQLLAAYGDLVGIPLVQFVDLQAVVKRAQEVGAVTREMHALCMGRKKGGRSCVVA